MSRVLAASSSKKKFKKRAPAPVPFPSENETHRASSSLVANIKVGCEAPRMLNYNLDIICAVQLRSSVKCISLFTQKGGKEGD